MTLRGKIQGGVVVLEGAATLPEGTPVEVRAIEQPAARQSSETLYERYRSFIGAGENLPADFADEHDHYIHGTPKRAAP